MSAKTKQYYGLRSLWSAYSYLTAIAALVVLLVVGPQRLADWWVEAIIGLILLGTLGCVLRFTHYRRRYLRSRDDDRLRPLVD